MINVNKTKHNFWGHFFLIEWQWNEEEFPIGIRKIFLDFMKKQEVMLSSNTESSRKYVNSLQETAGYLKICWIFIVYKYEVFTNLKHITENFLHFPSV